MKNRGIKQQTSKTHLTHRLLIALGLCATAPAFSATGNITVNGETYTVNTPDGFRLELLTTQLDSPRILTFHEDGSLYAGSRSGEVYRIEPPYTDPFPLNQTFDYPHSVAFRGNDIYVASTEGLYRGSYNAESPLDINDLSRVATLPAGGGHRSRTVKTGPDNRLYLSIGISGNCSNEYLGTSYSFNKRRGGVFVLDELSKKPRWKMYSNGLRNPVGFDWHPVTNSLYASNNGPDHLGYEQPPEVFAHLSPNSFHGMPWYQYDGNKVFRDKCISKEPPKTITQVTKPAATFPARNAPMDVLFIPDKEIYGKLAGNALVALRGSWATQPSGGFRGDPASRREPKIMMVKFKNNKAVAVEDLVTGFQLPDGERWARPVGLALGPDGAIYISSDSGNSAIFRLTPSNGGS